jgi:N utilization substance protein B
VIKVTNVNSNNKLQKRTIGREYAFKFLYKHLLADFSKEKEIISNDQKALDEAINLFDNSYFEQDSEHPDNQIDIESKKFAKVLILGALKNENDYSKIIEKYLTSGNLQKVDRMNLAVLLLGSFEIINDKETSPSVYINEYVNIAKKYCPTDASGFVNSVLDKLAKEHVS